MAKTLSSAIGVDLGRYSLKSVLLQKKSGDRYVITHFASMPVNDGVERTPEAIGTQLKALIKQMGGNAKGCAVAVSSPEALVRIIEQPETPPDIAGALVPPQQGHAAAAAAADEAPTRYDLSLIHI